MGRSGAEAVFRTLDLISELGHYPTGASVSVLAERLGVPAPTVHRLLQALVGRRFAVQDPVSKRYALGSVIISLANRVSGSVRLVAVARPVLDDLCSATRETVFLSMFDGKNIVYLDCIISNRSIQMWGAPGMCGPVHATSQGKAILAFLPEANLERILATLELRPFTQRTITDKELLLRELRSVRERGFATSDEEHEEGVRSVAAPILDASGHSIAAVCVGVPAFRVSITELERRIAPAVLKAVGEISKLVQEYGIGTPESPGRQGLCVPVATESGGL